MNTEINTLAGNDDTLLVELQDKEYRDLFVVEHIQTSLPFQTQALREQRGWSQKELAERTGITQTNMSRIEDPDYGKLTLRTLLRLASALDVALFVRFVPFSFLVNWTEGRTQRIPGLSHDARLVLSFQEEFGNRTISTILEFPTLPLVRQEQGEETLLGAPKRGTTRGHGAMGGDAPEPVGLMGKVG
ncbi:MAG: helix-turn-helix transcriptional regulator [Acidobacteriota bacterium]